MQVKDLIKQLQELPEEAWLDIWEDYFSEKGSAHLHAPQKIEGSESYAIVSIGMHEGPFDEWL